ncbi:sigma-70 family RNA polymerase sigma factor [Mesobacillus selenatarsenatis]|uniref:RNA polymerase sigma-70 factor, ECF subfamily n=1 Tax=Mesobacillus selenatarsenatis (strain DSM 18680 / JCM 14380 / FERM P-15431 / SF-1) TaxID=1321606 RepID=A0A0A8X5G5_MESS1|nr:sigma-70 family RNA polymerase sigma factor [Mesobacillus selenatarsenatis]GAM14484.1 RNA polymerase sigma-70 factor, ECF subfamily [Mesobacillus selenatarsenatis SF-1]
MEPGRRYISNEELLEVLIENYAERVNRLAYTYVKSWQAAEDITQEVFVSCYKNLDSFRCDSSYKTWIFKITVNKCKDYLKSKWYKSFVPFDFRWTIIPGTIASPEEEVIEKNTHHTLSENVMSLPKKYREVIILYYYEDLNISEISKLTNINLETVKTRLRRAKALLRKKYEGVDENGE